MERSAIIRKLMDDKGLKVSDVSKSSGIAYSTVKSILENGIGKASYINICKICDAVGITADKLENLIKSNKLEEPKISKEDFELLGKYHDLDPHGKKMVDFTLQEEWERSTAEQEQENNVPSPTTKVIPMRFLSYYQRMASAGRGEYLFSDIPTDVIAVPNTPLSRRADFVIGVNGRSMEDTYFDGDKVLVEKTHDVPLGEIGIFIRGEECFIKEVGVDRLISHNEDKERYPDIIPDERRIDTIGIVLGKVGE